MVIVLVVGVWFSPKRVSPDDIGRMTRLFFCLSAAAWGLSKVLPHGWLDLRRTAALAVALSGFILYFH
jgi:hypothetical protein